jgi:hypothetical protein
MEMDEMNGQGNPSEDPRPMELRPQEMSKAESIEMKPRIREQALPEKDDDRFFDRWVVDKARILGGRAVRQPALEKLKQTVRSFAEWRSLRHGPDAERQSLSDKALVASAPERIKELEAEAARLDARVGETEREAGGQQREVEEMAEGIADLRPALRGSRADFPLVLASNVAVFGVDFYVIQVALETIPGTADQRRLTAAMLGAGAVLVGDLLGWIAAAGSFRRDGSIQRPRPAVIAAVASLLILAVWFFGELGDFREFGLDAAKETGPNFGSPTFFTFAQILFLIGSAVASFAYAGRRTGRELWAFHQAAVAKLDELKGEVKTLKDRASKARREAAETPGLCLAAEERIRSREQIADGLARKDLKQGKYLESLIVPEYMSERAAVESGIYRWQFGDEGEVRSLSLLGFVPAVVATLAAGGVAYWVVSSALISIVTGVIVAGAYALAIAWANGEASERKHWEYVAQLIPSARKGNERATDIEALVPTEEAETTQNESANGNGRRKGATKEELRERIEKVKEILGDEDR